MGGSLSHLSRINNIVLLSLHLSENSQADSFHYQIYVVITPCFIHTCTLLTFLLGKFGELEMPKYILVVTSVGARVLLIIKF